MGWLLEANVFKCEFFSQFKCVSHFQLFYSHFYSIFNLLHPDIISKCTRYIMLLFSLSVHDSQGDKRTFLCIWGPRLFVQLCLTHTLPLGRGIRGRLHWLLFWNTAITKIIIFIFYKIGKQRNDNVCACIHSTNAIKIVQLPFYKFFQISRSGVVIRLIVFNRQDIYYQGHLGSNNPILSN